MTLPPWNPDTDDERRAFMSFVIGKLDDEDNRLAQRFAAIFIERSADPDWASKAREQFEAERLARKHGGIISWPEDRRRKGAPSGRGPLAKAARDVRRIRSIFRQFWPDKARRVTPPSAEQIAADRWNLSAEEAAQLHKKIQRNT